MGLNIIYSVYRRTPGGKKREQLAKFADFTDAVNYAHAQSVGKYKGDNLTAHWADGKVAHRFVNGERQ